MQTFKFKTILFALVGFFLYASHLMIYREMTADSDYPFFAAIFFLLFLTFWTGIGILISPFKRMRKPYFLFALPCIIPASLLSLISIKLITAHYPINDYVNLDQESTVQAEIAEKDTIIKIVEEKFIEEKPEVYTGPKAYELQLMSLTDHTRARQQQQFFENHGYSTKIIESYMNTQLFYRIRIDKTLYLDEAKDLGAELKEKFPVVKKFWIERVK